MSLKRSTWYFVDHVRKSLIAVENNYKIKYKIECLISKIPATADRNQFKVKLLRNNSFKVTEPHMYVTPQKIKYNHKISPLHRQLALRRKKNIVF